MVKSVLAQEHLKAGDSLIDYPSNSTINLSVASSTLPDSCKVLQIINRDSGGQGGYITVNINGVSIRIFSGDSFPFAQGLSYITSALIIGVVGMDVSWVASR